MKTVLAYIIIFLIIFFGWHLFLFSFGFYKTQVVTDKVIKTERVVGYRFSRYMVFGKKEVYEDTDSLWFWKWNSADVYGGILTGQTCTFVVYGWRVPLLSWNRNILKADCK